MDVIGDDELNEENEYGEDDFVDEASEEEEETVESHSVTQFHPKYRPSLEEYQPHTGSV